MKKTEDLTLKEMNYVFGVLMDSKLQKELMDSISEEKHHENVWMLDYVYDSSLRTKLEKCYEVAVMNEELRKKQELSKEIKIKL